MTVPPVILNPECDGLIAVLVDRGHGRYSVEIGKPERFRKDANRGFISLLTDGDAKAGRLVTFPNTVELDTDV